MPCNKNSSLLIYAEIRSKYFSELGNKKELKSITREIMIEYADLPVIELATMLELVRKDYNNHLGITECQNDKTSFRDQATAITDLIRDGVQGYQESLAQY